MADLDSPTPKSSPWTLIFSSRKGQISLAAVVLVLILATGAEVMFIVLALRGKMSVEQFMTATFVTLPTAVAAIAYQLKGLVDAIAKEDTVRLATPPATTNTIAVVDAKVVSPPA